MGNESKEDEMLSWILTLYPSPSPLAPPNTNDHPLVLFEPFECDAAITETKKKTRRAAIQNSRSSLDPRLSNCRATLASAGLCPIPNLERTQSITSLGCS